MSETQNIIAVLRPLLEADRRMGVREWPVAAPVDVTPPSPQRTPPMVRSPSSPSPAARPSIPSTSPGAPARPPYPSRTMAPAPVPARASTPAPAIAAPPPAIAAPPPAGPKYELLRVLDESQVRGCTRCGLCRTRTQTVFGQGNPNARLVFVGEAPGFDEDRQGQAFVGKAGQLLTRMIAAMGLTRDEVFICNVLKCRPPGNRTPAPDEIASCQPYLRQQLQIIQPEVIVALGAPAAQTLLNTTELIGRMRGRFRDCNIGDNPFDPVIVPLMPTYHPSYLLRIPSEKAKSWADLQEVMARLGLKRPQ